MKTTTTTILAFLFLICAALPLYAADLSDLTYDASGATVTITDCDEAAAGDLVIPDTIEGKAVTAIGFQAFLVCANLTSITLPEGVTSIEAFAFDRCTNLNGINIPEGVIGIEEYTFRGCRGLTSINIPDSVSSIGINAFQGCSGLTGITIGDGVTGIGNNAFYDCTSLASVTFGNGSQLTSIGFQAFGNCSSLTSINIPEGVTSIGDRAFHDCIMLGRVHFEGAFPTFGTDVFLRANQSYVTFSGSGDQTSVVNDRPAFNPNQLEEVTALEQRIVAKDAEIAGKDTQITALEAQVAELSQRPTLEEVRDGRPGSVLLSVDSEAGSVVLDFTVEESEDLITWTPVAGPGVSQTLTLPEGKRFYRFAH
jgi:hypothetical protein